IRTQEPGKLTFPIGQALVDAVVTVTDDEVKAAMRFLLQRLKLLVEPTGAVPAALLFSGRLGATVGSLDGKRIGIILSGGNVDPNVLADVLREGSG
ncbi:MAG: pyridoxal-phosphate dependent enzyme, partial [Tepidiformaceae bacterium]